MDLPPSQVRQIILDEHGVLRRHMGEIDKSLKEYRKNPASFDSSSQNSLREKVSEFAQIFLAHIRLEETLLKPALAAADAWGPVRVGQLEKEHAEQQEEIEQLLQGGRAFSGFAEMARKFLETLKKDMEQEEKECLSGDVLRDDIITISGCSE